MSELVRAEEYGLEEGQVKEIELAFSAKIAEREILTKQYEGLIQVEMSQQASEEAGDLRRKLVKVRTGISKIHKTQKAFFLASGRFVDAWKNKETEPVSQMEERLTEMEEYYKNLETERIQKLHDERFVMIQPLIDEDNVRNFGEMTDEDFQEYYRVAKKKYDAIKTAEHKEAQDKAEREAAEEARILADKKKVQELAEKNKQILAESRKKEEADKAEIDRLKKEKEASDITAAGLRKEKESRIKKEEEDKEAAIVEEEAVAFEKANRDDTKKWLDVINDLSSVRGKYEFTDEKNQKKYLNVGKLLTKVIGYINE